MEPNEAPLSTSPSSFSFSPQRHFYLAVDRLQFKMETLVDLLNMAGRLRSLPIVVSCSTRDELDAVCSALSSLSHITIDALYSDLFEAERARVLARFRQATMRWNKQATAEHGDAGETEKEEEKSHLIVVTDVCLPLVNSGESPISARVLINYELPTKKKSLKLSRISLSILVEVPKMRLTRYGMDSTPTSCRHGCGTESEESEQLISQNVNMILCHSPNPLTSRDYTPPCSRII